MKNISSVLPQSYDFTSNDNKNYNAKENKNNFLENIRLFPFLKDLKILIKYIYLSKVFKIIYLL